MRLSFDEIRELTVGAVSIFQDDSRNICFERCTGKQITAYYAFSETLGMRSRTTTGVRLDFHTNSATLSFTAVEGDKFEYENLRIMVKETDSHRVTFAEVVVEEKPIEEDD